MQLDICATSTWIATLTCPLRSFLRSSAIQVSSNKTAQMKPGLLLLAMPVWHSLQWSASFMCCSCTAPSALHFVAAHCCVCWNAQPTLVPSCAVADNAGAFRDIKCVGYRKVCALTMFRPDAHQQCVQLKCVQPAAVAARSHALYDARTSAQFSCLLWPMLGHILPRWP